MIARLALFLFLSTGCVRGTCLNMTRLSATEGMILSGGYDAGARNNVEVFVPSTGLSCSLPALPDQRYYHTMDSLLICGGDGYLSNCLSFTSGHWITSHTLIEERSDHNSWQTEQGLMLMGGLHHSADTSEIVATTGGQGGPSFAMQYSTMYDCSMPDLTSVSVFITGGIDTKTTVSRYGVLGWLEDLPSLVVGRWNHGCGSFFRADGTQVLLVAGGLDNNHYPTSTTEVLTMDSPGWTLTTPLPRAVSGLRGVTATGRLYMTGGYDGSDTRHQILGWLDDEQEWEETGKMKMARFYHAVSTIQMDDQAMEHCG